MKKTIGSICLGILTAALGYPVLKDGQWNINNVFILISLITLWNLAINVFEGNKNG